MCGDRVSQPHPDAWNLGACPLLTVALDTGPTDGSLWPSGHNPIQPITVETHDCYPMNSPQGDASVSAILNQHTVVLGNLLAQVSQQGVPADRRQPLREREANVRQGTSSSGRHR